MIDCDGATCRNNNHFERRTIGTPLPWQSTGSKAIRLAFWKVIFILAVAMHELLVKSSSPIYSVLTFGPWKAHSIFSSLCYILPVLGWKGSKAIRLAFWKVIFILAVAMHELLVKSSSPIYSVLTFGPWKAHSIFSSLCYIKGFNYFCNNFPIYSTGLVI